MFERGAQLRQGSGGQQPGWQAGQHQPRWQGQLQDAASSGATAPGPLAAAWCGRPRLAAAAAAAQVRSATRTCHRPFTWRPELHQGTGKRSCMGRPQFDIGRCCRGRGQGGPREIAFDTNPI